VLEQSVSHQDYGGYIAFNTDLHQTRKYPFTEQFIRIIYPFPSFPGSAGTFGPGNGGKMKLSTHTLYLGETASIVTAASSSGSGGDINIKSKELKVTDSSRIRTVTTGSGNAGDIRISGGNMSFTDGAQVSASASDTSEGVGGNIDINSTGTLDIGGRDRDGNRSGFFNDTFGMVPLRESFLSADELLPEPCETRDPEQAGSFIVDSDEGLPPRPDELLR
jgi:large exoprotein involved in heme utilization and adhesion